MHEGCLTASVSSQQRDGKCVFEAEVNPFERRRSVLIGVVKVADIDNQAHLILIRVLLFVRAGDLRSRAKASPDESPRHARKIVRTALRRRPRPGETGVYQVTLHAPIRPGAWLLLLPRER